MFTLICILAMLGAGAQSYGVVITINLTGFISDVSGTPHGVKAIAGATSLYRQRSNTKTLRPRHQILPLNTDSFFSYAFCWRIQLEHRLPSS